MERVEDVRESEIVDAIQKALEARGMIVWRIGQRKAKGAGNTVGAADLLIAPDPQLNRWVAVEVKVPGGEVRPTQRPYVEAGCVALATCVEEALTAVAEWNEHALE